MSEPATGLDAPALLQAAAGGQAQLGAPLGQLQQGPAGPIRPRRLGITEQGAAQGHDQWSAATSPWGIELPHRIPGGRRGRRERHPQGPQQHQRHQGRPDDPPPPGARPRWWHWHGLSQRA
ncbi:hypothetical protein [Cyanobium sp. LEGE 06113]|uniref:hypothetical protein n=1 Tax=Cyanobium sp. LEGE 06113 TaxID=1297573 RepID=UPI001D14F218|nr:hypothetical protein [Cyanobium sp. LEGE 06113]